MFRHSSCNVRVEALWFRSVAPMQNTSFVSKLYVGGGGLAPREDAKINSMQNQKEQSINFWVGLYGHRYLSPEISRAANRRSVSKQSADVKACRSDPSFFKRVGINCIPKNQSNWRVSDIKIWILRHIFIKYQFFINISSFFVVIPS